MSETLYDLTLQVARALGIGRRGTATGGSTTTIVDTNDRTEADDYWNNGTAWIVYDAGGASAAPEGEASAISDFANSSSTITIGTLTAAVAASDQYFVTDRRVPLEIIIQNINRAVAELGRIPQTDTTSLVIAADQTEYSLPTAVRDLRKVEIERDNTDSDDNQFIEINGWEVQPHSTAGTADTLILPMQYASGYYLKISYLTDHPNLDAMTDTLHDSIPIQRVIYPAIVECLYYRKDHFLWPDWQREIQRYEQMAAEAKQIWPRRTIPVKPGKLVNVTDYDSDTRLQSTVNTVYL